MIEPLKIDVFKDEKSIKEFVDEVEKILKESNGNPVPIYYTEGKLIAYIYSPDSPYLRNM